MRDRRGEGQPRIRGAHVRADGRQGAPQRPEFPTQEQAHTRGSQQRSDEHGVACPLGMAQRMDRFVLLEPPPGRNSLKVPVLLRPLPGQIGDQIGAEQRVDAVVPGSRALDQRHLQTHPVEQPPGIRPAGQLGTESRRQGRADADHPEEALHLGTQPVEDLDREVLGDRALVPREVGEEGGRVIAASQGECGEPESGRPALRARVQPGHLRRRQLQAGRVQQ